MITKLSLCLTVADTSNLTVVLDIDHWLPSNISRSNSEMLLHPGAHGGSRATSCTPHLIMCMLFCSLVWYAYNGGN